MLPSKLLSRLIKCKCNNPKCFLSLSQIGRNSPMRRDFLRLTNCNNNLKKRKSSVCKSCVINRFLVGKVEKEERGREKGVKGRGVLRRTAGE